MIDYISIQCETKGKN